ncbi:exodeoxyribonuclease VII large subunit [Cysteiniphilum sp. 6C5]|uniref:exodeoxyribonuclease VII large subunit n=1 Tax=unclassified Cysteiniphilum TaxID=2610889 RepID=UPI003F8624EB
MNSPALTSAKETLKLSDFLAQIKQVIDERFKGHYGYWVRGEISQWQKNAGHFYGELVEFDDNTQQIIAKVRVNMWANTAIKINAKFQRSTGESLKSGLKVLLLIEPSFHQAFGLSLNILDIDPNFTLGDRQARRQAILTRLEQEELRHKNLNLTTPTDFTHVAVISSKHAAGLQDFFTEAELLHKHHLCQFDIYHASMQGKTCATDITVQLRTIYKAIKAHQKNYDCIVIIRGGGAESDLDGFNYFEPANAICHMPIAVFTGIGHKRDQTVLDELANKSFDTPSKVIQFIKENILTKAQNAQKHFDFTISQARHWVQHHHKDVESKHAAAQQLIKTTLNHHKTIYAHYFQLIISFSRETLSYQKQLHERHYHELMQLTHRYTRIAQSNIEYIATHVNTLTKALLQKHTFQISHWHANTFTQAKAALEYANNTIQIQYKSILNASIEPTLKRGFSLTSCDGKYMTSAQSAKSCDKLTIHYHDGQIAAEITNDK